MGLGLSHPVESKKLYRKGNKYYKVGAASMHGWRESMEDAHCLHLSLNDHPLTAVFGIFDGHSGHLCSQYVSEKLPQNISKAKNPQDENELRAIALQTDEDFLTSLEYRTKDDGSAAIFTVSTFNEQTNTYSLVNANIGDSRTILAVKEGEDRFRTVGCTVDHKPTDEKERRRIEATGGSVQMARVDGQLALSRAFGDRLLKIPMTPDFPRENRRVCANPDFYTTTAKQGDFLFLACDGIFEGDVFTREDVIQWISDRLTKNNDPAVVCADLLAEVLKRGSRDNMSAMIILFEDGTSYSQDKLEYVPGQWHSGENDHKFQEAYVADARAAGYDLTSALKLYRELLQKKKDEALNNTTSNSYESVGKTLEDDDDDI